MTVEIRYVIEKHKFTIKMHPADLCVLISFMIDDHPYQVHIYRSKK